MYSAGKIMLRIFLFGILVGIVIGERVHDWKDNRKTMKTETK